MIDAARKRHPKAALAHRSTNAQHMLSAACRLKPYLLMLLSIMTRLTIF
jgi:hypothetical protein